MPVDDEGFTDTYTPEQERTLCEAIIEALAQYRGTVPHEVDCILYEYTDSDALTKLLLHDAGQHTFVQFTTGDAQITLWRDDGVEIRVRSLPTEPLSSPV